MNIAEQARVSRDQMQMNRVMQAIVKVGMDKWRKPKDLENKTRRMIQLLAATGDAWLTDDAALLAGVEELWGKA